jgi:hypothetical protein
MIYHHRLLSQKSGTEGFFDLYEKILILFDMFDLSGLHFRCDETTSNGS